jgi:hypothetical protein
MKGEHFVIDFEHGFGDSRVTGIPNQDSLFPRRIS